MGAAFVPALLNAWQRGFPLVPRPFAHIALLCDSTEQAVLAQYRFMQAEGLIDRIGPVFRPNTVGASTLAAMAVPPGRLEALAALVEREPGVNHNYEREHRYNLWFVATGASDAEVSAALLRIEGACGLPVLRLPLVEEYHIDLGFDLVTGNAPRRRQPAIRMDLSARERQLIAHVAGGLPLVPRPYAGLGLPESEAIDTLRRWLDLGVVRRIGAVARHRRLGYAANAMAVWNLPDEKVAAAGRRLGADPAVTLCYRRARALPDWPYNLYCMVHGRSRDRTLHEVRRLDATLGAQRYPHAVLFSRRCFGQRAARYGARHG